MFADWQESVQLVAGDLIYWTLVVYVAACLMVLIAIPVMTWTRRLLNRL